MKTKTFTVRFTTPAFLGDAEQSGQWRTPPFKALLRQWWRVVVAPQCDYDHRRIREREAELFGNAWLRRDGRLDARKSQVRIRLERWAEGKLQSWDRDATVFHPEVGRNVGAHLYLGYGPLIKPNAAIQAGDSMKLHLAYPEAHAREIETALSLIHLYGAIGGRSRNGWGSLELEEAGDSRHPRCSRFGSPPLKGIEEISIDDYSRDWKQALNLDSISNGRTPSEKMRKIEWAHALGKDEKGPLIWRTNKSFDDWRQLMRELARIKIALRTMFVFSHGGPHPRPEERHWLAYPVTHHDVRPWNRGDLTKRLPNTLRFKVRRDSDGKLYGVIFHMPCRPHDGFQPDSNVLKNVWRVVHKFLDELCKPATSRGYTYSCRGHRHQVHSRLTSDLNAIQLERCPR